MIHASLVNLTPVIVVKQVRVISDKIFLKHWVLALVMMGMLTMGLRNAKNAIILAKPAKRGRNETIARLVLPLNSVDLKL